MRKGASGEEDVLQYKHNTKKKKKTHSARAARALLSFLLSWRICLQYRSQYRAPFSGGLVGFQFYPRAKLIAILRLVRCHKYLYITAIAETPSLLPIPMENLVILDGRVSICLGRENRVRHVNRFL